MTTAPDRQSSQGKLQDHRVETAQRKREQMRSRILEATTKVFIQRDGDAPVIEDVVREAGISRGAFYKHFSSLDEALVAAGVKANDRAIADMLPVYDCLSEPWQRAAVGFRLHIVRASLDPRWAGLVTRLDAWPHESSIATHMSRDLARGLESGQFHFDDLDVTIDFVMGASVGGVQAVLQGLTDPVAYADAAVRLLLQALGCTPELRDRAVAFSRKHVTEWLEHKGSSWISP